MKILACIDLSPVTEAVLQTIDRLAVATGAEMHLLHVVGGDVLIREYNSAHGYTERAGLGPHSDPCHNLAAERLRRAQGSVDALAERLRSTGTNVVTHVYARTHSVNHILDAAEELKPDMIVVGSHGHGLAYHLLVGSTTQGILQKATCPVLVVPAPREQGTAEQHPAREARKIARRR